MQQDESEFRDNPYLYDAAGPRKKVDYSVLQGNEGNNEEEDLVMYDESQEE